MDHLTLTLNAARSTLVLRVIFKNATLQTQIFNSGSRPEVTFKGKSNFPLDYSWIKGYLWVSYSHLFLINQQPVLWPSGAEYEKEFPEGADTKPHKDTCTAVHL
jgi:hypothetical protein